MIRILEKEFVREPLLQRGGAGRGFDRAGHVVQFTGLLIESEGPVAAVGEVCRIDSELSERPTLAQVVGFRDENLLLMPLGEVHEIHPGSEVTSTGGPLPVPVGDAVKGRIIDGLGNPLDGLGPLALDFRIGADVPAPPLLNREPIREIFHTGIKALDVFAPCGRGQCFAVFGGSGVGKSTLLGIISRQSEADVNVIALIGARAHEVSEFIENQLGADVRQKSVVIVAGANEPALARVKAAFTAASIAEYFRDAGANVFLTIDSITRVAMAQRDISLAIGEPASAGGYTPSVFSLLPQLLERSGPTKEGSITGLFSVLADAEDRHDPIADSVRSIVDGEIVLTRELALQNHFPAIDVLASLSRLNRELLTTEQVALTTSAREALATYRKNQELILRGAIAPGSHPAIEEAVRCHIGLQGFLHQDADESFGREETWKLLGEALASAATTPGDR